jgi:hypothetical protein
MRDVLPRSLGLFAAITVFVSAAACERAPAGGAPGGKAAPGAGMRVYRDPVTGAFTEPPPGAVAPPPLAPAAPIAPLAPVAAPGGGTMVRLGGAFKSDVTAKAGSAGPAITCTTTGPR